MEEMRFVAVTVLVFVALSTCVALQSSLANRPTGGAVHGKVTQNAEGQPVRKATVQLAGQGQIYSAATDADGEFTIEGIPPGKYTVSVEHAGFVESGRGNRSEEVVTVQSGKDNPALILRMELAGVIVGKIVDIDGDPLRDVGVSANRVGSAHHRSHDSGSGGTNDLGEFRIPDLRPGHYVVSANARDNLSPSQRKSPNERGQEIYATTYYPGTLDEGEAASIQVQAGGETPVNFGLLTTRVFRVSGSVLGIPTTCHPPLCGADLSLEPQEKSRRPNAVLRTQVGQDAKFEFPCVFPGTYVARLTIANFGGNAPDMEAVRLNPPITVSDDSEGIRLQAERGGIVRGRLHLDNREKFDWTQLIVLLVPLDEQGTVKDDVEPSGMGIVRPDGTFELQNVTGGTYQLMLAGMNRGDQEYIAKSVEVDGKDGTDSGFQVHPNIEISVVVSANGAIIEGTVVDDKGNPVAGASVVDIPSARLRSHPDAFQQDTTDEQGHFRLRGLRPGEYTVFAFEDLPDNFRQADFSAAYEGHGEKVRLDEGTRKTISVKFIPTQVEQE